MQILGKVGRGIARPLASLLPKTISVSSRAPFDPRSTPSDLGKFTRPGGPRFNFSTDNKSSGAQEADPFRREVELTDGTKVTIAEWRSIRDGDFKEFYKNSSTGDQVAIARCSQPHAGENVGWKIANRLDGGSRQSPMFVATAMVDGTSTVVAAGALNFDEGTYTASEFLIHDAFKKKGLGTALKIAQLEFAMADKDAVKMCTRGDIWPPMEKIYTAACRKLGLSMSVEKYDPDQWESGRVTVDLRRKPKE
jgi:hypothetical protein